MHKAIKSSCNQGPQAIYFKLPFPGPLSLSLLPLSTSGPHFSEFLSLQVGDDCSVTLVCKVNTAKLNNY